MIARALLLLGLLATRQAWIGVADHRRQAHELGVLGDRKEVERTDELHRQAGVGDDLFTARESVGLFEAESRTERVSTWSMPMSRASGSA